MDEDKTTITTHLMVALHATSWGKDLESLMYEPSDDEHGEQVIARFNSGAKKTINVNMDSGFALIQDVMAALEKGDYDAED